jgi:PAS domain S-box-containing protein
MDSQSPWPQDAVAYRLLFESNPCPMWVYERSTLAFLAVNDAAVDRYGFTRDEFLGMTIRQIRPPEEIAKLEQNLRVAREGPERTGPWKHRTKTGELMDVEIASRSLTFDDHPARLVVVSDITTTLAVERELEETRIRTESIVANAIDAIVSMDATGTITGFNPAAERTFLISRDEAIGRRLADVIIPQSLRSQHEAGLARFLATGEERVIGKQLELSALRSDGTEFPVEVSITVDATSGTPEFTGFIRDVTERREVERVRRELMATQRALHDETQKMNTDLERRVAVRTKELETANRELEAFSYSVSHDLRAPLRAMDGFARLLADELHEELGPEGMRYVGTIRESARHMGELVDDLLTFSRLGRSPLRRQKVQPAELVERVLVDLDRERGEATVTVEELPPCDADPTLLGVVFTNLLSNAFKYSGKRDHAQVRVGSDGDAGVPCYFVADNGVGFDMRYADKLFGVFQRLHRMEDYEGTGVGLATAQRIVQRHGGRIWADAAVDRGATFFFTVEGAPVEGVPHESSAD